ncbi:LPXTG cell wall anchor domain-containing protein [Actinocrispum wychmicini]|uniref:LPXTG-motif cell wall-anchored protein n=1 Tax=Actinocrispum wychmicini TaxID=1213861 RepID=A0A4R2JZQ9_9PSEU|nr:LPXTG cell wall anchor domain-containing protein [Actinocrispum wychmicini]TCO62799.1 LPXTG-motif cell wall-anchored protein [Actinocrispum wychmicini]
MRSFIRAAARPARNVLLAGLVGFAVVGASGVAVAAKPGDHAPLKHGHKPAKAAKRAAADTNPDVPTVDRDFGCLIPEAPGSGPGIGDARVTVTDRHDPQPPASPAAQQAADANTFTYKVTLLKNAGGEDYKEFKTSNVTVAAGQAGDPVEFKDIPGGTYKAQVQLVKDGKPVDGIVTEKSELDRCGEIQGPVTGPLQVFQRCDASKGGLLTIRAFARTAEKQDYTITVTGEADRTETQLSTGQGEQNYGIPYDEVPFADGTYTVRVFVKGDTKIDQSQTVTVACKASHQPTDTPTTPAVSPAANVSDTHGLANTGASVLWPTVIGVAVLALGGVLFVFGRRRGAAK